MASKRLKGQGSEISPKSGYVSTGWPQNGTVFVERLNFVKY